MRHWLKGALARAPSRANAVHSAGTVRVSGPSAGVDPVEGTPIGRHGTLNHGDEGREGEERGEKTAKGWEKMDKGRCEATVTSL